MRRRTAVRSRRPGSGAAPASRPRRSRARRGTARIAAIAANRMSNTRRALVVGDEVDVALPVAGVDVGEAVPLLGQRPRATSRAASNVCTLTESSPFFVFITVPSTPTQSPRSTSSTNRANASSPRSPLLTNSCSSPVPSRSVDEDELALVARQRAPGPRRARRRRSSTPASSLSSQSRAPRRACGCGRSGPDTDRRRVRASLRPWRGRVTNSSPALRVSLVPLEDDAEAVERQPRLIVLHRARRAG